MNGDSIMQKIKPSLKTTSQQKYQSWHEY